MISDRVVPFIGGIFATVTLTLANEIVALGIGFFTLAFMVERWREMRHRRRLAEQDRPFPAPKNKTDNDND